MKKLMLLASLLVVLSVSAQERPQGEKTQKEHRSKPTVDEQLKRFDSYNLSSSQKEKVRTLLEDREKDFAEKGKQKGEKDSKNNEFDSKLEQILDKNQFSKYKQEREKKPNHDYKGKK